jgi:hypothetical protein
VLTAADVAAWFARGLPGAYGQTTFGAGPPDAHSGVARPYRYSAGVSKLFYLALNISEKWTMPLRDWKGALNRLTIQFEERMTPI